MSANTKIEWCDASGNVVIGCDKVSAGCKNCYAERGTIARVLRAKGIETWGNAGVRQDVKGFVALARKLNRQGEKTGIRPRFFANSNSDWLDDKWSVAQRATLLQTIHDCPNVDFLLLTKRAENFMPLLNRNTNPDEPFTTAYEWSIGDAPENVWIGGSVENQAMADERIPELLKIPARVRFLSCEPLLGPVDISHWMVEGGGGGLDWIIVGGESGRGARPCNVEWIRGIVQQCKAAGVPCFVKQLGRHAVAVHDKKFCPACDGAAYPMELSDAKGGNPADWPEDLRVREFPGANTPHPGPLPSEGRGGRTP